MVEMTEWEDRSSSAISTVYTVLIWVIVIPLLNVVVPLFFQAWNVVSLITLFAEEPSAARVAAQMWKLYVAEAVSLAGTVFIGSIIVVLAMRHLRRRNHWIALILSASLTVLWFIMNKVLGLP